MPPYQLRSEIRTVRTNSKLLASDSKVDSAVGSVEIRPLNENLTSSETWSGWKEHLDFSPVLVFSSQ